MLYAMLDAPSDPGYSDSDACIPDSSEGMRTTDLDGAKGGCATVGEYGESVLVGVGDVAMEGMDVVVDRGDSGEQ